MNDLPTTDLTGSTGSSTGLSLSDLLTSASQIASTALQVNNAIKTAGAKTAADKAAQVATAAQSTASAKIAAMWPWILGGVSGLLLITGLVLLFRRKKA